MSDVSSTLFFSSRDATYSSMSVVIDELPWGVFIYSSTSTTITWRSCCVIVRSCVCTSASEISCVRMRSWRRERNACVRRCMCQLLYIFSLFPNSSLSMSSYMMCCSLRLPRSFCVFFLMAIRPIVGLVGILLGIHSLSRYHIQTCLDLWR